MADTGRNSRTFPELLSRFKDFSRQAVNFKGFSILYKPLFSNDSVHIFALKWVNEVMDYTFVSFGQWPVGLPTSVFQHCSDPSNPMSKNDEALFISVTAIYLKFVW